MLRKRSKAILEASEDLRPEYRFDYAASRANPYAASLSGRAIAVVLDPEVAKIFPTSESLNTALRAVMTAIPRRSTPCPCQAGEVAVQQGVEADEAELGLRFVA